MRAAHAFEKSHLQALPLKHTTHHPSCTCRGRGQHCTRLGQAATSCLRHTSLAGRPTLRSFLLQRQTPSRRPTGKRCQRPLQVSSDPLIWV